MGDGQHAWAAAEWLMMMRNMFVREEPGRLVLGSGLPEPWTAHGGRLAFGPTPTPFGDIKLFAEPRRHATRISWKAAWRNPPEQLEIALPGHQQQEAAPDASGSLEVKRS